MACRDFFSRKSRRQRAELELRNLHDIPSPPRDRSSNVAFLGMREINPECSSPWGMNTGQFSPPQARTPPPSWPPRTPPGCEPSPVTPMSAIPSRLRPNLQQRLSMSAERQTTPSKGVMQTPRTLQTPKYYVKRGSDEVEWDQCPPDAPSPVAAAFEAQDPLAYFKSLGYPIADEEPEYTEEEEREMNCLYPPRPPPPAYDLGEAPDEPLQSRMYRQYLGQIVTPSSHRRASITPRPSRGDCDDGPSPRTRRKLF